MTGYEQPPKCNGCKKVMLSEYVAISHWWFCPDCFKQRTVHKVDPAVVGWYVAGQALAKVPQWQQEHRCSCDLRVVGNVAAASHRRTCSGLWRCEGHFHRVTTPGPELAPVLPHGLRDAAAESGA